MLLQGVAALRLQPGSSWVGALQAAVLQQLDSLSPRDISQVCVLLSGICWLQPCGAHCPACPPAFLPGVWCACVHMSPPAHSLPALHLRTPN